MESEQGKPTRTHTEQQIIDGKINATKHWRKELDVVLQQLRPPTDHSRERSEAITKIQSAIMWLGMDLEEMAGGVSCYEHGYDPSNAKVDLPADGVKL